MLLATTANEEFWDKNCKIIFLHEGCKLYTRKHIWQNLDSEVFSFQLDTAEKIHAAIQERERIYEKVLPEITEILNRFHGIQKKPRYYKILLGAWLRSFIGQLYEKFWTLSELRHLYPDCDTLLLPQDQFYIPLDYYDYTYHIHGDEYSLQLYSQILEFFGGNRKYHRLNTPISQPAFYEKNSGARSKLYHLMALVQHGLNRILHSKKLVITSPYYSRIEMLGFAFHSRFKYILDDFSWHIKIPAVLNRSARTSLKLSYANSEFERLISKILFSHLPFIYLEGFKTMRALVKQKFSSKIDATFTANALGTNSSYSFFQAENESVTILAHQHGGGFGFFEDYCPEVSERENSQRFYSWGWKEKNTRILPHPKLNSRVNTNSHKNNILLVLEEVSRYWYRLTYYPIGSAFFNSYLKALTTFIENLDTKFNVNLRPYPGDFGWSVNQRLQDHFTNRHWHIVEGDFNQAISEAKLCVIGNFSTSFLDTLSKNIPTVVFYDPKIYRFRKEAQKHVERLIEVGIFHDKAENAAQFINEIFHHPDDWWNKDYVQKVRSEFVEHYAITSKNWQKDWRQEFNEVLEHGATKE